jgi:CrcB protein
LGGFTTLSTYADRPGPCCWPGGAVLALAYVLGTLAAALIAVWLGLRTAV